MKNKILSFRRALACAALVGGLAAASTANAVATIVIVNGNAANVGFNDPTPVAPVGGNTGTTLGEQRLIAFTAAANKWGATLTSAVTIRVLATFEPLTCTATGAVLGSAGATQVFSFTSGTGVFVNTWYPKALVNKLVGAEVNPAAADLRARFNINLGQPGCLTGVPFYLGLDNNHGPMVDLYTVLLHEMGHGLGFQTFTSGSSGSQLGPPFQPSVWDHFLKDQTQNLRWVEMTDAQRVASAVNTRKLVWLGANVTTALPSVLSLGVPRVIVSGPQAGPAAGTYELGAATFGPQLTSVGVTGDIMPVVGAGGLACTALSAIDALAVRGNIALVNRGTCDFSLKALNVQNAGAIGVLVADNVAGSPPPGLGGTNPAVTIPAGRITLGDATAIRAQLNKRSRNKSGVVANLSVNATQYAGADPLGFAQLYTPVPFSGGSSVSHFDAGAFPNLLMEPAINGDLTHEPTLPVDLTFELLKDIGW
jgi:hypothetical protein